MTAMRVMPVPEAGTDFELVQRPIPEPGFQEALVSMPDDLGDEEAAPLLCAGITTFNALRQTDALPDVPVKTERARRDPAPATHAPRTAPHGRGQSDLRRGDRRARSRPEAGDDLAEA